MSVQLLLGAAAEPWMASLKIAEENQATGELCRGSALSFGYFSLGAIKEK
jgi:hypothetical protein